MERRLDVSTKGAKHLTGFIIFNWEFEFNHFCPQARNDPKSRPTPLKTRPISHFLPLSPPGWPVGAGFYTAATLYTIEDLSYDVSQSKPNRGGLIKRKISPKLLIFCIQNIQLSVGPISDSVRRLSTELR